MGKRISPLEIHNSMEERRKKITELYAAINEQYARKALRRLQPHSRFRNLQLIPDEEGDPSDYILCINAFHAHDELFQDMKPRIQIVGV